MKWFITGASSGFGLAIAKAALARGDMVAGTVRGDANLAALKALHPTNVIALKADVTDREQVFAAAAAAEEALGGIEILFNNAGFGLMGAVEEASPEEIKKIFDVNVFGAINVLQAVLPYMRKRRAGHVINVTSVSGYAPWAGSGLYGATKFAMEGLGRTLASEVAELGIKVTNLAPGGFATEFSKGSLNVVANKLEDYEGLARDAERSMRDTSHPKGDPAKLAKAVLSIAGTENPPVRFLIGKDALGYAEGEIAAIQEEIAQWRDLSLSTAAD